MVPDCRWFLMILPRRESKSASESVARRCWNCSISANRTDRRVSSRSRGKATGQCAAAPRPDAQDVSLFSAGAQGPLSPEGFQGVVRPRRGV